jgi:ABC-type enterochelin transport system permease subunit
MSVRLKREESNHITYYFTAIFSAIGIALVFYILHRVIERINLFVILLSISAGGIPIGCIGVFIDYKISEYKFRKRSIEQ